METVNSPSSIKSGHYGDSKSGEVSYFDLQKNSFVDLRARKHTPTQAGDFHDPTNFIRNQISKTLHMRSTERAPIPLPRRTYDSDRKNDNLDQRNNKDIAYTESPSSIQLRSPDVSLLRSHINIGGTSVRLRNPQRLSPARKTKTMSWMEPPSRKVTALCSEQRRHSNIPNDEKYLNMLKQMDERRKVIETDRMKNMDRRDCIEKEKRLKEDLWSSELDNLQKELDAVLLGDSLLRSNASNMQASANSNFSYGSVDTPKVPVMIVSENNNNNNTPRDENDFTYVVKSSHFNSSERPKYADPGTANMEETFVKKPAVGVRKSLHFEKGDHQRLQPEVASNVDIVDPVPIIMNDETHVSSDDDCLLQSDTNKVDSNRQSYGKREDAKLSSSMKFFDLPTSPSHERHKISAMLNPPIVSTSLSRHPPNRLNTFNISNPTTSDLHDVPVVSPYKSCSEVKVIVENPPTDEIDMSGVKHIGDNKQAVVELHEQENRDPNTPGVPGNTFLSTYDSFAYKITNNYSNQSTPHKSESTPMEESPDRTDVHDDSNPLMKTVERNCSRGEGYELVDDTTPNTMMAKKKELFLLKQLKKEEELKRKRAEREQEEERKKEEARIKQEEMNAKREEEKLKRQQILEDYKKRKMEQEENQRMRETGDIIATTKKHTKSANNKGIHNNRKGHLYASSLAGSVSNISEAGTAVHSEVDGYAASVRSAPATTKRLSVGYRMDWETESALSSVVNTEYNGPKLYKEPSLKSNKHIINNAICHCCLPGKVNETTRMRALQILEMSEARHFMILFRDSKCQFRALYIYDPDSEKLFKLDGNGPSTILPAMIDCLYKYNSGRKSFASLPSKTLSVSIDAVTIKNSLWQSSKRGKTAKK